MSAMSYTLGDGGGAVVLQRIKPNEQQGIHARWFLSDSSYWRIAVVPLIDAEKRRFKSNAAGIEQAAMRHVPSGVRAVMDMLKWSFDDIDLIVPHQVSSPIIENLFFKELRAPREKVFWSFPSHGNVGAASMPVAFCQAQKEGRLRPGDKILLVGGSGGFGAGVIGLIV
jgi:3-oxoacyl-[acyl-carrier-protein] synthase-3